MNDRNTKQVNYRKAEVFFVTHGIKYMRHNNGSHLITQDWRFDFWPASLKFRNRKSNTTGIGLEAFLSAYKGHGTVSSQNIGTEIQLNSIKSQPFNFEQKEELSVMIKELLFSKSFENLIFGMVKRALQEKSI
jgi:hypothetical protein